MLRGGVLTAAVPLDDAEFMPGEGLLSAEQAGRRLRVPNALNWGLAQTAAEPKPLPVVSAVVPGEVERVSAAHTRFVEGIAIENLAEEVWRFSCYETLQVLQACQASVYPVTADIEKVTSLGLAS